MNIPTINDIVANITPYAMGSAGALFLLVLGDMNRRVSELTQRMLHVEQLSASIQSIDDRLERIEAILDKIVTISVK